MRTRWTKFHDMHSGGGLKEGSYSYIYIEAPEEEAKIIFYNRFGHNPERVSCTCCGADYSISEYSSLAQASGYERNCRYLKTPRDKDGRYMNFLPEIEEHYYLEEGEDPPEGFEAEDSFSWGGGYVSLDEYVKRKDVLVIRASEIKPEEREGEVPEQGYVWHD